MVPFYGWGSTASRLEPLRAGSLVFTTNGKPDSKNSEYCLVRAVVLTHGAVFEKSFQQYLAYIPHCSYKRGRV